MSSKITIIWGPQASGKSKIAEEIASHKRSLLVFSASNYCFPIVPPNVELVVIEEITDSFVLLQMIELVKAAVGTAILQHAPEIVFVFQSNIDVSDILSDSCLKDVTVINASQQKSTLLKRKSSSMILLTNDGKRWCASDLIELEKGNFYFMATSGDMKEISVSDVVSISNT